jgi:hypothetical protein
MGDAIDSSPKGSVVTILLIPKLVPCWGWTKSTLIVVCIISPWLLKSKWVFYNLNKIIKAEKQHVSVLFSTKKLK